MKFVQRFLIGVSLLSSLVSLSGCGKGTSAEPPGVAQQNQQLKHDLAEEISRTKKEYDEKLKELQRKYAAVKTASLVAKIGRAEQKVLEREVEQPGWIMSMETTPIYTFYAAYIQKIGDHKQLEPDGKVVVRPVDRGDIVKKGDVLATLFVPEREYDLTLKKALVEQTESELKVAETFVKVAEAGQEAARADINAKKESINRAEADVVRWKAEDTRSRRLVGQGVFDQQTADEVYSQLRASEAIREEAKAKWMSAKATYQQASAQVSKAEADLKLAEARIRVAREHENVSKSMLDYKEIKAPFDGVITERLHHTGRFVTPPSGAAKIDPLFTIVRMDIMRIFIDVPEADAAFIRKGDKALVRVKSLENKKFPGTVTRTAWVLDQSTRTLRVEVDLPNPKGELRPGQYAYGYIPIQYKGHDGKGVWTLPDSALIQKEEEGNFIFRIDEDGKAILTPVRLGVRVGHSVQVLKYLKKRAEVGSEAIWSVFNGTETIIMNPNSVVDGMKIEKTKSSR